MSRLTKALLLAAIAPFLIAGGACVLGAVITLIIDIERPQGGSLTVSQVPLIQLQDQIGPPSLATTVEESSE